MNAIRDVVTRNFVTRWFRGPAVSRLLARFGIDSRRYWLLLDLFGELSDRGEMLDQLGSNRLSLKMATRIYFAFSVIMTVALAATQVPFAAYLGVFLLFTTLILLSILLLETGNSLLNPVEALVLAHQPINGATYTAAKLTHLLLILLYLVPGLNVAPAIGALALRGSHWWWAPVLLLAAFGIGITVAFCCCATFGWLLRFIPARRLKATAQLVGSLPLLGMMWMSQLEKLFGRINLRALIPGGPMARRGVAVAIAGLAVAGIVGGLRSLSADFLIRVSSVTRGGASAGAKIRRSLTGSLIARFFGGQPARAGSAFLSRMMLRDWHFRRQILPMMLPLLIGLAGAASTSWRTDPFARHFSVMHVLPHIFGFLLLFICSLLPYGNDYKGGWLFLTVPASSFSGFARGVWATLWLRVVAIPHIIMLIALAPIWGMVDCSLFVAYSAAVASIYLSLVLRMVENVPFTRQPDASRGTALLPILLMGGAAAGIVVAAQFFLVFRSVWIVLAVTVAAAAGAWLLTRSSLTAFAESMRFHLSLASQETGAIYKEIS
jgi:hypothetical protein